MEPLTLDMRLEGAGITPATLDALELANHIEDLYKAVDAMSFVYTEPVRESESDPEVEVVEPPVLSLTEVRSGSAWFNFATSQPTAVAALLAGLAVSAGSELPYAAQEAMYRMSERLARLGMTASLNQGPQAQVVVIGENNRIPSPRLKPFVGVTTLYGKVIRVGGHSPTATLQLDDGRKYTFKLPNREMAKVAAQNLYGEVTVVGEASWSARDFSLVGFRPESITAFEETPIDEWLNSLAQSAQGAFDGHDVADIMAEIRGEDQ